MNTQTQEAERLNKRQALFHWKKLPVVNPETVVTPIPYGHKGTTYAEDCIRITGSKEFVEAVMSQLKGMLYHENEDTRIQINFGESTDKKTGLLTGSWAAFLQVFARGKGRHCKGVFG